jgi:hypothetical protein
MAELYGGAVWELGSLYERMLMAADFEVGRKTRRKLSNAARKRHGDPKSKKNELTALMKAARIADPNASYNKLAQKVHRISGKSVSTVKRWAPREEIMQ